MNSIGIYIHCPFCIRKCGYCDFFSVPIERSAVPHEAYLQAIRRQLIADVRAYGLAGREVTTVYFGGGTPSLFPPSFFQSVLESLRTHFSLCEELEVSCEANPGTIDAAWLREARAAGITRLSIGVQSFQPRLLAEIGRIHSADGAMAAIAHAQDAGFQSVSIDLMFGLPGETMGALEEDLRTAMTFQPQHLSVYQLTLEEGTLLAGRIAAGELALPAEDDALKQFRTAARMLARGGWPRYEISNFAKPGFECRHNLHCWRYSEYLGLGAGATSFLYQDDEGRGMKDEGRAASHESRLPAKGLVAGVTSHGFARRWTQSRDLPAYLEGTENLAESEEIDCRTAMAEFCFLGLRTSEGIAPAAFAERFGTPFESVFGTVVQRLSQGTLLESRADRWALTPRGLETSNGVFLHFFR